MAVLSSADRAAITADIMRALSAAREPCSALKAQIRAIVDAADDFMQANQAAFNSSIPAAPRAAATTDQKTRIFSLVLEVRRQRSI